MKYIDFFGKKVSKLIIGGNPFSGNSHIGSRLDNEMLDYYSSANILETLKECERNGINTVQLRGDSHILRLLREHWNEGGKLQFIGQTAPEIFPFEACVRKLANAGNCIAIYHHGSVTDQLYKAGEIDELKGRLSVIRKTGLPVGLCSHMPEVFKKAEEEKWDVDFYMGSLYNLSKEDRVSSAITGKANEGERFDEEDRQIMLDLIASVDKTCLAFKVLGASRRCTSEEDKEAAINETLNQIKKKDAMIIGVFQKYNNQIVQNSNIINNWALG